MVGTNFPAIAALLGLLATHPAVEADLELLGAVDAVQLMYVRLWTDIEVALM